MPRMRTIEQAAAWVLETDPCTALTKTGLRRLVISGELPSVKVGKKYLLDLDVLESYLNTGHIIEKPAPVQGIRPVIL